MRAYPEADQEALRARDLLQDWATGGFLTEAQFRQMEQETICPLRRTNMFLRLILALFTSILVGALVALFFAIFYTHSEDRSAGVFMLIFAAGSYAAAELAVREFRLYRHGIEEALLACSVVLLCAGIHFGLFTGLPASQWEVVVPVAGAIASLAIWARFGLPYAFLATMIIVLWLPQYVTSSATGQHALVAAMYAAGLAAITSTRARHRLTYRNGEQSIAEAFLWLGIYLAINLQLSRKGFEIWISDTGTSAQFPGAFFWTTWLLTWCLPPAILLKGIRGKDRLVMAAGTIAAVLTLATNKAYLGWQRHTWDPMLLGLLLGGTALLLRRWLAAGPQGIRRGFTAQRFSAKDKRWMNVGSAALGMVSPHSLSGSPQPANPEVRFGGGDSGGGGATSDF